MVIEVEPVREDVDKKALKVFMKSLEVLGGPRKIIEHKNLTWLPSLMEACYAIVLKEVSGKTEESIAKELGLSTQTIRKILSSDEETVLKRLRREMDSEEFRDHVAGGIAKLAWKEIKAEERT